MTTKITSELNFKMPSGSFIKVVFRQCASFSTLINKLRSVLMTDSSKSKNFLANVHQF